MRRYSHRGMSAARAKSQDGQQDPSKDVHGSVAATSSMIVILCLGSGSPQSSHAARLAQCLSLRALLSAYVAMMMKRQVHQHQMQQQWLDLRVSHSCKSHRLRSVLTAHHLVNIMCCHHRHHHCCCHSRLPLRRRRQRHRYHLRRRILHHSPGGRLHRRSHPSRRHLHCHFRLCHRLFLS